MSSLTKDRAEKTVVDGEQQLVALHLGAEMYGVDIACIHTVIMPQSITPVPQTPDYVRGIMNLRGQILPVLDLRTRFRLAASENSDQAKTRIVIVNVDGIAAGLIVDAVSEVLRLKSSEIEPPSGLLLSGASDCITGIGRISGEGAGLKGQASKDRLILLLDVKQVLASPLGQASLGELPSAA
jgi:purine-binding chemotaxis protein CheW